MHASHIRQIIWVLNTKKETKRHVRRRKGLEPVFIVVVKRILILVMHTTPERHKQFTRKEKSYNTYVIVGFL